MLLLDSMVAAGSCSDVVSDKVSSEGHQRMNPCVLERGVLVSQRRAGVVCIWTSTSPAYQQVSIQANAIGMDSITLSTVKHGT